MRIADVIGGVTLSRSHPSLRGGTFRLVVPLSQDDLRNDTRTADPVVAWDGCSANEGSRVLIAESAEAAAPFLPNQKPVGAYIAAILDTLEIEGG